LNIRRGDERHSAGPEVVGGLQPADLEPFSLAAFPFAIDGCSISRRDRLLVSELVEPDGADWISVILNWPARMTAKSGR